MLEGCATAMSGTPYCWASLAFSALAESGAAMPGAVAGRRAMLADDVLLGSLSLLNLLRFELKILPGRHGYQ